MNEKKIEPTQAMVEAGASYAWEETNPGILGWNSISERHKEGCRRDARAVLTAALNHPDAPGLFESEWKANAEAAAARAERAEDLLADAVHVDEAARRVEAAREQGWDDAAQHIYNKGWEGVTALRKANPHRPARELPTEGGIVIVANDGHDDIEAIGPVSGATWRTKEAVLGADGRWYGVWRLDARTPAAASVAPEHITLDTCKVDDR